MCSLYARLGGGDAIRAAVDEYFDRLLGDPELARYFAGRDVGRLARHLRPFLAAAFGGPDLYRGRDMLAAHAGMGITNAHFDRAVRHLVAVLAGMGVDQEALDDVAAMLEPLRALIVQAPLARLAA